MRSSTLAVLAALVAAGCGGPQLYPETDVIEPSGFTFKKAAEMEKAPGGLLAKGLLEYEGSGDIVRAFRSYLADMKLNGWASIHDEVVADKATGKLRKDNRTCTVEFAGSSGTIRAVIKVEQSSK